MMTVYKIVINKENELAYKCEQNCIIFKFNECNISHACGEHKHQMPLGPLFLFSCLESSSGSRPPL